MDENPLEIRDDEINVEEIMAKIRENIRRRQAAGELPPDPDSVIGSPSNCHGDESEDAIQGDLSYINSNWDIHNNSYFISSHHPHIGKFLVKGRQMVHGEVRRYVDPMISRQTEFNASTVRIITRVSQQYRNLESSFVCHQKDFDQKISDNLSKAQRELDTKKDALAVEYQQILDKSRNAIDQKFSDNLSKAQRELDIKIDTQSVEYQQILDRSRNAIDQKFSDNLSKAQRELDIKKDALAVEYQQILDKSRNAIDQKFSDNLSKAQRELDIKKDALAVEYQQILDKSRNAIDQLIFSTVSKIKQDISSDLDRIKEYRDTEIESILKNIETINPQIEKQIQDRYIHERFLIKKYVDTEVDHRFNNIHSKSPPQASFKDISYLLFEEQFRGTHEDIKLRQEVFLPYFNNRSNVLDIGCGRGEFLEILKEHNICGRGIDIDSDMVAHCRSRMLEVQQVDAVTYLETLDDGSLDGIFIDQVVEHLEPDYLFRLLALCYQKMKFGYHIVIETVNPLSFVSFVNFYIDMTHKRPVHPETLQYLLSAAGFRECEKKFFSPVSDESRLKKVEGTADMNETETKNVEVYNHNVEMLNTVLFGAQDYAVVGKK